MSRSKRTRKHPVAEYNGKRPGNKNAPNAGVISKKITHKKERQNNKRIEE